MIIKNIYYDYIKRDAIFYGSIRNMNVFRPQKAVAGDPDEYKKEPARKHVNMVGLAGPG